MGWQGSPAYCRLASGARQVVFVLERQVRLHPLGLVCIAIFTVFLAFASWVSDPVFNVYYGNALDFFGVSGSTMAQYILVPPKAVGHAGCYGVLAVLSYFAFRGSFAVGFFLPFAIGAVLEFFQMIEPTRSPGLHDLLVNCGGIVVALFGVWLWCKVFLRSKGQKGAS